MTQEHGLSQPVAARSLQEIVVDDLGKLNVTKVVVVDDALSPGIDLARWPELMDRIRDAVPDLYSTIDDLIAGEAGNVEVPPSDVMQMTIRRLVAAAANPAFDEFLCEAPAEPALQALITCLKDLGLDVHTFWRADDAPKDAHLYFVDYRLQPESQETYGKDASQLIAEALAHTGTLGQAPGAVLMSRMTGDAADPDEAEREAVSRNGGGFVRCNFRYCDKTAFADRARLLFLLHDLLNSMPVGRAYVQQVHALQDAAVATIKNVAREIYSLLPADFSVFGSRIAGQPQDLELVANHLLSIFSGLLCVELRNNPEIETTVKAFRDLLQRSGMMAPEGLHSHSLHRIHSKLLYDQSPATLAAPLAFGDIYKKRGDVKNYFLVLTPECDLEPRVLADNTRGPKVDSVLLLPGIPGSRPLSAGDTVIVTPLFLEDNDASASWISWQMRGAHYVPSIRLRPDRKRFVKWGRLRNTEAEQIQLRVATDLLAVGLDDVSDGVIFREATLWRAITKDQCEKIASFAIAEMLSDDPTKPLWALSAGTEHLFSGTYEIFGPEIAADLRTYTPKAQFVEKLKRNAVGTCENKTGLHFGWFATAQFRPQKWQGPPSPPAQDAPQPEVEQPTLQDALPEDAPVRQQ